MSVKFESSCIVCTRKAVEANYCEYHFEAFQSLRAHYDVWKSRYGEISWYNYLKRLKKIKYTGKWVREVIEIELKKV